jgi:N6-L-threonylcarbamoyladenine synthase
MVYVLDINGQPLMPTERYGKVRRMLKSGKAKVVKRCPFVIQLSYTTSTREIQRVSLGVDAGSKHIGISATTESKVLYESEVELRSDITELLSARREMRSARRNRKTRHRKPRFDNRRRRDGWLAPSVQQKVNTHLTVISKVNEILPVAKIIAEVAAFDIQKIKNPAIQGAEYQQGEQLGSWNIREYVLFRDGHTCQCCKGKSKDKILNVHHIESRQTGGDAPNNLITLCKTCHNGYHSGEIKLPKTIKRGMKFADATFMGIMRWAFYNEIRSQYPDVSLTYGYITKHTRIMNGLPKAHHIDARCISGHPLAKSDSVVYYQKKVRCHNRQIHKLTIGKGAYRKRNQCPYEVKGFRLYDKVKAQNREWYVHGRRLKGSFVLKTLDGNMLEIAPSKISRIGSQAGFIIERRPA